MINQQVWENLLNVRNSKISSKTDSVRNICGRAEEFAKCISSDVYRMMSSGNGSSSHKGRVDIGITETAFGPIRDLIGDVLSCIWLCKSLGTQMNAIPEREFSDIIPKKLPELTGDKSQNTWVARMVRVLNLRMIGGPCDGGAMIGVL